jgi:hypothetical protein
MRTTVRLPDELYQRVRVTAASEGLSVTSFLERALREALEGASPPSARYQVEPFHGTGLMPGVDLDNSAALEDLLDEHARG